ncbi:hypothetical protein [Vibrio genomosp. F10]|uniref:hypothetical protein n=1 Tax=Vibrio genomosp. F10 TaxID=723171 RepID=UPI0002DE603E|nr:hypothetical protein [Vibrio genomosp. F10]OEF08544.1 hypothetical protein A1QI_16080 [Vibrio genomosp. F10 str. 9ZB36]
MNTFTKTILATTLLCSGMNLALADESTEKVDPSNLTAVNTSGYVGMNNQGDVKLSASLGFGLKNGQMAMGTLEGSMDNEGKYKDSRLQYFHVFNVGNPVVPTAAASIDIIDNTNFTTAAVGAVAMFKPGVESLTIFGRVGALAGEYDEGFASAMGETDTDIVGGMAAAYLSWKPGADGTYLMLSPEYTYMDGSIETSTLKSSITVGTPLSADGKRWGQFKIENTVGSMQSTHQTVDIDDTVAWAFYKVYF